MCIVERHGRYIIVIPCISLMMACFRVPGPSNQAEGIQRYILFAWFASFHSIISSPRSPHRSLLQHSWLYTFHWLLPGYSRFVGEPRCFAHVSSASVASNYSWIRRNCLYATSLKINLNLCFALSGSPVFKCPFSL